MDRVHLAEDLARTILDRKTEIAPLVESLDRIEAKTPKEVLLLF